MKAFIKTFSDTGIDDVAEVGEKNALLGEIYNNLAPKGIPIPDGFVVNAAAYEYFLDFNALKDGLRLVMAELNTKTFDNLEETGAKARKLIMSAKFPRKLENAIIEAYDVVFQNSEQEVAVRSSATVENFTGDSLSGLYESYLNIKGHYALIYAIKRCFASLFTDAAIKYREEQGFDHSEAFISVGVQQMVRADLASSGIGFFVEPEPGFKSGVSLCGTWGLEKISLPGTSHDEFTVLQLIEDAEPIIRKKAGSKQNMLVYHNPSAGINTTIQQITPPELREKLVLEDHETLQLASWAFIIEGYFGRPVIFQWAKDGLINKLYIIGVRFKRA